MGEKACLGNRTAINSGFVSLPIAMSWHLYKLLQRKRKKEEMDIFEVASLPLTEKCFWGNSFNCLTSYYLFIYFCLFILAADFGVSAKNNKTLQRRDSFIGTPYWWVRALCTRAPLSGRPRAEGWMTRKYLMWDLSCWAVSSYWWNIHKMAVNIVCSILLQPALLKVYSPWCTWQNL